VRAMSIGGENYERSIIPLASDISRFSRGTLSPHMIVPHRARSLKGDSPNEV
jgi:hypothetical protein